MTINPRWGFQIEGDADAISDLERCLNADNAFPLGFVMFWFEGVPVVRALHWDGIDEAGAIATFAEAALRRFSGALNIYNGSAPLKVGTLYEFKADGQFEMSRITTINVRVTRPVEARISPEKFKNLILLANKHEWLTSALLELAANADWYGLYRAVEAIEKYAGGEKAMRRSKLYAGEELKRVKRMANSFRHLADSTHLPPVPPVDLGEATRIVSRALELIVGSLQRTA